MLFIYSLAIRFYVLAIRIIAPFHAKAKDWITGRKMQKSITIQRANIWVHCASLGEFEQIRPVLKKIRLTWPEKKICLSFFSPSGYIHAQPSDEFDQKIYIPADLRQKAERLIGQIDPELVIFTKNDFWYNHLKALNKKKTHFITVATTVRSTALFLKPFGKKLKNILLSASGIFVQDERSLNILKDNGFENVVISGDTRIDRVLELAKQGRDNKIIEEFKGAESLIIFASTHAEDEKLLLPTLAILSERSKILIAPHEIGKAHIQKIRESIPFPVVQYSEWNEKSDASTRIMILDNIGTLSGIYRYASTAYIGGGFGKGIHNTLEPAAFHIPLCFGPNYNKFPEATYFINAGTAICVKDHESLYNALIKNMDKQKIDTTKSAYQRYFKIFGGGSDKPVEFIRKNNLLS